MRSCRRVDGWWPLETKGANAQRHNSNTLLTTASICAVSSGQKRRQKSVPIITVGCFGPGELLQLRMISIMHLLLEAIFVIHNDVDTQIVSYFSYFSSLISTIASCDVLASNSVIWFSSLTSCNLGPDQDTVNVSLCMAHFPSNLISSVMSPSKTSLWDSCLLSVACMTCPLFTIHLLVQFRSSCSSGQSYPRGEATTSSGFVTKGNEIPILESTTREISSSREWYIVLFGMFSWWYDVMMIQPRIEPSHLLRARPVHG